MLRAKVKKRTSPRSYIGWRRRFSEFSTAYRPDYKQRIRALIRSQRATLGRDLFQNGGRGVHVIFPLLGVLDESRFMRGFLRIVAPHARVTRIVTPRHDLLNPKNPLRALLQQANQVLLDKIKRINFSETKRVIIIDHKSSGGTLRALTECLRKVGFNGNIDFTENNDADYFLAAFADTNALHQPWRKNEFGTKIMKRMPSKRRLGKKDKQEIVKEDLEKKRAAEQLGCVVGREYLKMKGEKASA